MENPPPNPWKYFCFWCKRFALPASAVARAGETGGCMDLGVVDEGWPVKKTAKQARWVRLVLGCD